MTETDEQVSPVKKPTVEALRGPFFWLTAFYVVYCARPEDWIPMGATPLAKITAIAAFLGLLMSAGKTQRSFKDLPKEAGYLLVLIGLLFVSGLLSPIWKGGAVSHTLDFSKVYVVWVLTFLLVTTVARLRRIIFIQTASVALVAVVSIVKGHSLPRLAGVLGGIYGNPNDLAFAMVLTLPFALMFMLTTKSVVRKLLWIASMLAMAAALVLTASRAGFIDVVIAGTVCLWHFGIKGKRYYLIAAAGLFGLLLLTVAGGTLKERFTALWSEDPDSQLANSALSSVEAREFLMRRAVEGIEHYPVLGVGIRNFQEYSTIWHDVHMTYLQICVEGGIPVFILYLLFFRAGFVNLKKLRKRKDLDEETRLFVGALHSTLIGFAVGALFAPEAYQFFPYFTIAYTSALVAMLREREKAAVPVKSLPGQDQVSAETYARNRTNDELSYVR
ncbi:MAG: O-antigen ligase family protein [Acidobacteriia bacterium]|nr:O-antigen ligase family protein [Terriglobia bacterium]